MMETKTSEEKRSIEQIRKEHQDKQIVLFDSLGVFWAFGNEQFEKQKQEGVEYSQISSLGGMIVPSSNVDAVLSGLEKIAKESRDDYTTHVDMDSYIYYSLNNHEAFYDGGIDRCVEDVRFYYPACTLDDIKRVYYAKLKAEDDEE